LLALIAQIGADVVHFGDRHLNTLPATIRPQELGDET
jgi:hypothetical protein